MEDICDFWQYEKKIGVWMKITQEKKFNITPLMHEWWGVIFKASSYGN